MFNHGISKMGDILDLGVSLDIVKKAGSFYSYGEVRLGQGREHSKEYLEQHLELAQEIEARLRGGQVPDMVQAIPAGGDDEDEPEEV